MTQNEEQNQTTCDLYRSAIEFIGKRWTGIIVYQLFEGPKRYHELLNSIDGISDRLLSERLKDLEQEGLLIKHVLADAPKKVEYELTPPGYEFKKVFQAMMDWAATKEEFKRQMK
ncbi:MULTISPECIES: winged helix-turn-helix transcriptional regulator [Sporosarcina]|uniref:winged helix-turn-helix transcriptional regulator n=1 Tax=Sporosarcina TaxID=1569 RepID=UPI001E598DAD|nr:MULTISPECIES: helix-turn-helix domain-containing protein [Sporosarcina]GKV67127.1 transcriptional regulator [Sporosarcina sp. NCCP-2331]GLB57457.1 transcriptional regulator [Sporosarcina sp. NCCP-2378]